MPSAVSPHRRANSEGPDELDKLLDYDNAVEDFLRDIPMGGDDQQQQHNNTSEQPRDEDQEVQVKRKRKPVPKLDENRLLSDAGIPKLRKITKTRLKFRGKGHEFTDISRLLNTYQLWLDDLYPRAKFRDALAMVEKVGHSKRMQVTRRAWLDDTKPHTRAESPDVNVGGLEGIGGGLGDDLFGEGEKQDESHNPQGEAEGDVPAGDDLDALLHENQANGPTQVKPTQPKPRAMFEDDDDEPDEDELDALLADQGPSKLAQEAPKSSRRGPFEDGDPDEDDLDALMAEQDSVPSRPAHQEHSDAGKLDHDMDDFADEEEAMASMGW